MTKIDSLRAALDFLDRCRADKEAGPTGALRDAREWVESAARAVVAEHDAKDDAITAYYTEKRSTGQPPPMPR
jgi:hypothetical protein